MSTKRICIITNAPISQNPRAVKEADALTAAGHEVHVIFAQHAAWTGPYDRKILDESAWCGHRLGVFGNSPGALILRVIVSGRVRLAKYLARLVPLAWIKMLAFSRYLPEQLFMAVLQRADLYIGHNPQSLPIVALAARFARSQYGFDSEDLHSEETRTHDDAIAEIEHRLLPGCSYLTAASPGIAVELARRYGLREPVVVYNTFRLSDRPMVQKIEPMRNRRISLYWFSQIAGLDRGIQDAMRAVGVLDGVAELHIRGFLDSTTREKFDSIARAVGAECYIHYHDPIPPADLPASAALHDIGLCLEQPDTLNRDICITNKIFMYLLAGIPVIATDTRGNREIVGTIGNAGYLYQPGDYVQLAELVRVLKDDERAMALARQDARKSSAERWNWENEQQKVIREADSSLSAEAVYGIRS